MIKLGVRSGICGALLVVLVNTSCTDRREVAQFSKYVKSLKVLRAPLLFSLDKLPQQDTALFDDSIANSYKSKSDHVVGRLFEDRKFVSIMYIIPSDVGTPILETYTPESIPIDTVSLSGEYVVDMGKETTYSTRIDTDGSITIHDTLFSVEYDSHENEIPGTDSASVMISHAKLEQSGHFTHLPDRSFRFAIKDPSKEGR